MDVFMDNAKVMSKGQITIPRTCAMRWVYPAETA